MVFLLSQYSCELKSKEDVKYQESIQSSTTIDPGNLTAIPEKNT